MSITLSVLNDAINFPGMVFTRNAVLFQKRPTLDHLLAAAAKASEVGKGMAWFLGDIGLEIQDHARRENAMQAERNLAIAEKLSSDPKGNREKIRDLRAEAQLLKEDSGESFRATYCPTLEIDPGYWRNCVMLARFFPPSSRVGLLRNPEGVSPHGDSMRPEHYRVAMLAAGGAKGSRQQAEQWLQRAQTNGWRPSELRKQVSLANATARPPAKAPETNPFAELDAADAWCIAHPEQIDQAHRASLRVRWSALIRFVGEITG